MGLYVAARAALLYTIRKDSCFAARRKEVVPTS